MDSVQVALRIRPLVNSEIELGCKSCVHRTPNQPQVCIGKSSQMFTYNYVFDELEGQSKVYEMAVKPLLENLFKGYNLTILAYGQTGSGKTYTMGTSYSGDGELGVIPRAVYDIFKIIEASPSHDLKLTVSFIELYNECLYDLLTQRPREQSIVEMREQPNGGICIPGLSQLDVTSPDETLSRLREGSSGRVVGSTKMNASSSRSHAIFTLNIRIMPKENLSEIITSQFHLVDLAGSERSKKTGATGDRFREGININKGLLVLGKVISLLGQGRARYINYRDSKLTRLLQDSLGGNSVTLMIACISPADYNQDETYSTLRYANDVRKIKNKPIVNQDPRLAELIKLRKENEELKLRIIAEGKVFECPPEHRISQIQLSDAQKKINQLSKALSDSLIQNTNMYEKAHLVEIAEVTLREKLIELKKSITELVPEDDPRLKQFKEKVLEVEGEHKKFEQEIRGLGKTAAAPSGDEVSDDQDDGDEAAQVGAMAERTFEYITSQSKFSEELRTLNKNILWKEELVAKLTGSTGQLDQMQEVPQTMIDELNELKRQITELQHEKEDLLRQIRINASSQNNSSKISETRRIKLQELDSKVAALTKKVKEQERLIKMKEKSDEKMLKLKQEILSLKQMKVRLLQQMKSENEKFKAFKSVKDREVTQLRTQNMKRQNQLKKIEQLHISQQNVLRRKLEAAAAANSRLMAVLERQKASRDKKLKGKPSKKIKERINEEVELLESEFQAQKSLDNLLQDRAALTKEMSIIKESLNDESVPEEDKQKLRNDLKQVEQELEFRSAEISDLQQKLLDINQDDQDRHPWESILSMVDAKFAFSYLFSLISEKVKEIINSEAIISDLKDQQLENDFQLADYHSRLDTIEKYYKKSLEKMEREYEEMVFVLMKSASENLKNTGQNKTSEYIKLFEKLEQLRKRMDENSRLSNNMIEMNTTPDTFKKFLEDRLNSTYVVPETKKSHKRRNSFTLDDENTFEVLDSSYEFDPDYQENDPPTSNHKQLKALKKIKLVKRCSSNEEEMCDFKEICKTGCCSLKTSTPRNKNGTRERSQCFDWTKRSTPSRRMFGFGSDKRPGFEQQKSFRF